MEVILSLMQILQLAAAAAAVMVLVILLAAVLEVVVDIANRVLAILLDREIQVVLEVIHQVQAAEEQEQQVQMLQEMLVEMVGLAMVELPFQHILMETNMVAAVGVALVIQLAALHQV
jgi:hypothetical protein